MLPTLVLAAAIAAVWRFGVWPLNRSYKYLPSYGQACACRNKTGASSAKAPVVAPSQTPV